MRISYWSSYVCSSDLAVIFLAVAGIVFIQKVIQAISLIEAQFIETFEQSLISTRSADILRRTGASTIGADRPGLVCARLFTRFDADLVLPEIAEVVFVHHALPHSQRQVGKCQFPQNFPVLDKVVTLTRPLRAEPAPMHHESMEMIIFRSEEHSSELQSLMRYSSAVFCLKKK